ncbi:MAG: Methyltransferase type 11 [candidate division CPR2 bacterium GW2011_GWC1_39_9]|uniref:Methyltransferase type 11 n=1 Tax=candidate division CPR2 bacterium GW2011_GWC2_39_10 TaxID=1618345 RepID=A0A0G0LS24_UNCC2|nr:MAG: Methyltransferase type 11 [candidate division CPR2 bacterium GW2011_GWC2_39_10]KKR35421.1 MAG: Methyltransferase type 11 [candidate division CPR2 bacterium GW2011_GWC1_39_9]
MGQRKISTKNWQKLWKSNYGFNKNHPVESKIFREIYKISNMGEKILEAGSGTGKISAKISASERKTYLLDIAPEAIMFSKRFFKSKKLKGHFFVGDIFKMPFADNSFDIVWNSGVVEHFNKKEIKQIYEEMRRVCKRGGKIAIIVPTKGKIYLKFKAKMEETGKWTYGYEKPIESLCFLDKNIIFENKIAFSEQLEFISLAYPLVIIPIKILYILSNLLEHIPGYKKIMTKYWGSYLLISVFKKG